MKKDLACLEACECTKELLIIMVRIKTANSISSGDFPPPVAYTFVVGQFPPSEKETFSWYTEFCVLNARMWAEKIIVQLSHYTYYVMRAVIFSLYHRVCFCFDGNNIAATNVCTSAIIFFFYKFFSRLDRVIVLDMEQENAEEKSFRFFDLVVKINASQRTGSEKINLSAQRPIPSNVNLSVSIYNTYIYQYITLTVEHFDSSILSLENGCFRSLFSLEINLFFFFFLFVNLSFHTFCSMLNIKSLFLYYSDYQLTPSERQLITWHITQSHSIKYWLWIQQ